MSFDEIYSPGFFYDGAENDRVLKGYVAQFSVLAAERAAVGEADGRRPDRAGRRRRPTPRRRADKAGRQACCPRR